MLAPVTNTMQHCCNVW